MTGIDREEQRFDKSAGGVPAESRSRRGDRRHDRRCRRFVGGRFSRRCRTPVDPAGRHLGTLPRGAFRRDAARPLVPRAARSGPSADPRTGQMGADPLVPETIVFVIPTGMWSVLNGDIDDAYNGLLGWFWVASVLGTGALILVCRLALKERQYSAVMAPPVSCTWRSSPASGKTSSPAVPLAVTRPASMRQAADGTATFRACRPPEPRH